MFGLRLDECPPGLFLFGNCLGFKSEYRTASGYTEAFCVESGESFQGGAKSSEAREALLVIPVEVADPSALRLSPRPDHN